MLKIDIISDKQNFKKKKYIILIINLQYLN